MTPPKPEACSQRWLTMKPTDGGRICPGCDKLVVDFTKKHWSEIDRIQQASDFTVCGVYRSKQLQHWGGEPPRSNAARAIATASLATGLAVSNPSLAQSVDSSEVSSRIIIRGQITTGCWGGTTQPVAATAVVLKGTGTGAVADKEGNYSVDVTNDIKLVVDPTLVFSHRGYDTLEVPIYTSSTQKDTTELHASLACSSILDIDSMSIATSITHFYAARPTFWQRVKWTVRQWFTRKED